MSAFNLEWCGECGRETVHSGPDEESLKCINVHNRQEVKCCKCHKIINLQEGRMAVYSSNFCLSCWDEERKIIIDALKSEEVRKALSPSRELWTRRN